ncbi:hypothetical protein EV182_003307 [Spiromyces aspiralis]|uniref:Uncharacterized protein n=1 Tax=Spiromyces aspiralis TaxID=68401 RepID=A0ACC1HD70_9FUNG|nr:hypothetical protein EV182_003307 [Spiromyces aspiralis]
MAAGDTEAKAASEQRLRDPIHPLLGLIVALACRAFPLTLNDPTPLGLRSEKGVSDHALADPTIFHPVNPKVRDTILPVMKEALSPSGQNCLGTRDYDIAASQVVWRRDWPLGKRLAVEHQRARSIYELIVPVIFGDRSRPLRKVTRLLRQPPPQPVRAFDTARDAAGLETPAQPSAPLVAPVVGKIVLDKQQATECLISFLRALEVDEHVIVAVREILPLLDGKEMTSVLRVVNAWQKKGPVFVKRWLRDHCFTPDVASCDVLPGADDARGLSSGPDTADTSHDVRLAAKEPTRAAYYRDSDVPASEKRQRELDSDEGDVKRQRRLSLITEAREASSASADSGSDDKQRRIRYYCRACGRLASQGMSEGTEICAVPRFCCQACEQVWTGSTLSQMSTLTPLADLLVQLPGGADGLAGDDGGMSGGGLGSDDSDGDLDVDGSMPMARLTATRPSLQSSSPSSSIALFANDVGGQGELVSGLWEAAMMDDGASASVLTDWVWSSIQPLELPTTPAARMAVTQRNDDQGSPMARVPVKRGTSTRPLKHTDELRQTFEHDGKEILLANSTKDVLFEAISQRVVVGKLLVDTVKLFLRDLVRSALKEIPDAPGCQGKGWQIIPPSRAINVHQKTSANSTSVKTVELPAAILTPWHVVKAIQRNPSTFDVCSNTYLGVDPVHSSDVLDL